MAKVRCDCGCGAEVYHNQLVKVEVKEAVDQTLRVTETQRTFYVTRLCREPFEEELGLMAMLQLIVRKFPPEARGRYWLINAWLNPFYPWPRYLRKWWMRVGAALKVMRLQHGIHIRNRGFNFARVKSQQSAILFAAPRFMQSFLARRFTRRLQNAEKQRQRQASEETTEQTAAAVSVLNGARP